MVNIKQGWVPGGVVVVGWFLTEYIFTPIFIPIMTGGGALCAPWIFESFFSKFLLKTIVWYSMYFHFMYKMWGFYVISKKFCGEMIFAHQCRNGQEWRKMIFSGFFIWAKLIFFLKTYAIKTIFSDTHIPNNIMKQAGAELGKAHLQLGPY